MTEFRCALLCGMPRDAAPYRAKPLAHPKTALEVVLARPGATAPTVANILRVPHLVARNALNALVGDGAIKNTYSNRALHYWPLDARSYDTTTRAGKVRMALEALGPSTKRAIREHAEVNQEVVTRGIADLIADGRVERRQVGDDCLFELTERGRE